MKRPDPILSLPEDDPARALRPIRLLVLGAVVFALLAGLALFTSVMHVMATTDAMSMAEERARAARIADILPHVPENDMAAAVLALGNIAGLGGLEIAPAASREPYAQSIPLLNGPRGGQFLVWTSDRPGLVLLRTHAPVRVPLILTMIGGVMACLLLMLRHVRRIESQRLEARHQALRDHLTGLPNLRALEAELARLAGAGQRFSVLALDLDRFKPVNDLFGHHAGDLALVEVGKRLAAQLQPGEFLARIGGDEFVAIVRRGDGRPALTQLARDCIAAVNRPLHVVGQNVSVGISLGIVEKGLDHPADALLKLADRALYQAKDLEGGAFCFAGEAGVRRTMEPARTLQRLRAEQ
ncbi:GGDEF domain-containing protein [Devosia sediminis]|uniref:Diguanylate cyclase n=1 Tax=Devosia sediminis TaxID=2798801 RepID=A0A934J045_9HYPH|nr:GGDEF domain-containing protein [Devosia sediminis]MBJ3785863.1 diguanylate cyclase [Devosia sediminis]